MELTIRQLNDNDYQDILVEWWSQWGWTAPEKDFLPDNGKGCYIIYDEDTPICAGFIYITNSRISWIDWIISNKKYTERAKRREAISLLVDSLTNISKMSGSKYAYALIKNNSLIKTYEELGYIKGDSYTSEMIKIL